MIAIPAKMISHSRQLFIILDEPFAELTQRLNELRKRSVNRGTDPPVPVV